MADRSCSAIFNSAFISPLRICRLTVSLWTLSISAACLMVNSFMACLLSDCNFITIRF